MNNRKRLAEITSDIHKQVAIAPSIPIYLTKKDFELYKASLPKWQREDCKDEIAFQQTKIKWR